MRCCSSNVVTYAQTGDQTKPSQTRQDALLLHVLGNAVLCAKALCSLWMQAGVVYSKQQVEAGNWKQTPLEGCWLAVSSHTV